MVSFEVCSTLSTIELFPFSKCSSLPSICIPSSVKKLGGHCFYDCTGLSIVWFAAGSNLSELEDSAFANGQSLSSICIPSPLQRFFARHQGILTIDPTPDRNDVLRDDSGFEFIEMPTKEDSQGSERE
jgi:hypothetical protein